VSTSFIGLSSSGRILAEKYKREMKMEHGERPAALSRRQPLHAKSSTMVLLKTDISTIPDTFATRPRPGRVPAMESSAMQALGFKT
jgi:hypothetical protein